MALKKLVSKNWRHTKGKNVEFFWKKFVSMESNPQMKK